MTKSKKHPLGLTKKDIEDIVEKSNQDQRELVVKADKLIKKEWEERLDKEFWKENHWLICDCDLGEDKTCRAEGLNVSLKSFIQQELSKARQEGQEDEAIHWQKEIKKAIAEEKTKTLKEHSWKCTQLLKEERAKTLGQIKEIENKTIENIADLRHEKQDGKLGRMEELISAIFSELKANLKQKLK